MKTVAATVVDSDPVSLPKAAKILSKFTSADNGASPAFLHYLMRASDAFNELVQLHKELSGSGSERRSRKHRSGIQAEEPGNSVGNYREATKAGAADEERLELEEVNGGEKKEGESTIGNSADSKRKKKIKKELSEEGRSNGGHGISNGVKGEEIEGKKIKKMKNVSVVEDRENKTPDFRENENVNGVGGAEKKLSKMNQIHEVEGRDGEIEKKSSKKRKSGEIGNVNGVVGAEEKLSKMNQIHEVEGRDGEIEKKSSKKRKSGEIGVDGEGTDSANKGMQSKKRKKVKSEVDN